MIGGGGGVHGGGWWTFMRYDEKQDQPKVTRALVRRVLGYAAPYRGRVALMLGAIMVSTFIGLIPPLLMRDLIDHAIPERDFGRLNVLALAMVAIPLVNGLIGVGQRYLGSQIGEGLIFNLRTALYAHLQRMSLRFFTNTKTGEIMSRLNGDVVGAQQAITSTVVSLITNVVALIATLAIMISLEWRLTLVSIAVLPLFILPARRVAGILREITREQMTLNAQMSALMNETLNVSGALLVKIFGRADDENGRFRERAGKVRDIGIRQVLIGRWFFMGLGLVSALGTAIVFWLGGWLVLNGEFTLGTVVAFGAYLGQLYGPISSLTNARVEFATSMVSFERVFEVLDMPVEIDDRPGAVDLERVAGRVEFDHVSFSYAPTGVPTGGLTQVKRWRDDAQVASRVQSLRELRHGGGPPGGSEGRGGVAARGSAPMDGGGGDFFVMSAGPGGPGMAMSLGGGLPPGALAAGAAGNGEPSRRYALRDLSYVVEPGQLAALVGPSGAGKTTITYLLPRLYDPTEGRILIDGRDLRDLTLGSLSRQIGMVTQETYLFHDSIRANLLYARPEAIQDEIEAACRAANIHDFIAGLPEGYDTVVGERGYRLSGGEKQRVAIARVILKDPRILVLDEATSHLDSQSEALIQAALTRVMRGRTSIAIAHRLSTVLAADAILVMDKGRLVERGTHAELLARGGLYQTLYETQFKSPPVRHPAAPGTRSIGDGEGERGRSGGATSP